MVLIVGFLGGRYTALLISLLLFLIVAPMLKYHPVLNFIVPLLFVAILLSALRAVVSSRKFIQIAVGLVLIGVAARVAGHFMVSLALFLTAHFAAILFLTLTLILTLGALFNEKEVTYDTIAGSICVYLLIGFTWGLFYICIAVLSPASFAVGGEVVKQFDLGQARGGALPEFIYFSFVTLTTLGYGDITPLSPFVRSLAIIEALVGPLYLTVLVARLVGLHITGTTR